MTLGVGESETSVAVKTKPVHGNARNDHQNLSKKEQGKMKSFARVITRTAFAASLVAAAVAAPAMARDFSADYSKTSIAALNWGEPASVAAIYQQIVDRAHEMCESDMPNASLRARQACTRDLVADSVDNFHRPELKALHRQQIALRRSAQ